MYFKKIFVVDSNRFDLGDLHDWLFGTCNGQLIKKYDQELQQFKAGPLREANLYFGPTCYYDWNREQEADCFSRSDCPGWKNRILVNKQTWEMMHHVCSHFTSNNWLSVELN